MTNPGTAPLISPGGRPFPPRRNPIRMVAIDLDGTLLTSRKSITRRTHTALRAAVAKGVHVVLATARPPRSVRGYYDALKLTTPTVNYNGALIWNESQKRVIEHTPLDVAVARKVIHWARKRYPEMLVSVEILDKWYTDHTSDVPEYMTETSKHFTPDFVGPIEAFLTVPITKLMLLGDPAWIADIELAAVERFGNVISQTRSDPHLLQIMNPAITKAGGLAKVAASLGIAPADVMAIGDAPNDIQMLEWAGLALAPENAWDAAKQIAHAIVPSNDADAVGIALQYFVLNSPRPA
ncbi:MAG TPA: Cof-type HAD-IIB family hydrolase [Phycisphaerae bacterium]|nr:Cof-type HAD-IIB family hydrolase [Phycisphaerae bacterium]